MSLLSAFQRPPDTNSTGDVSVLSFRPMRFYLAQWSWSHLPPLVRDLPRSDRRSKLRTLKHGSWLSTLGLWIAADWEILLDTSHPKNSGVSTPPSSQFSALTSSPPTRFRNGKGATPPTCRESSPRARCLGNRYTSLRQLFKAPATEVRLHSRRG